MFLLLEDCFNKATHTENFVNILSKNLWIWKVIKMNFPVLNSHVV